MPKLPSIEGVNFGDLDFNGQFNLPQLIAGTKFPTVDGKIDFAGNSRKYAKNDTGANFSIDLFFPDVLVLFF